jgi:tetratricopeptide (TPR) repeat protein
MSTPALPDFQREIGTRMSRGDFAGAAAAAAGCRAAWPSDSAGWLLGSIAALHADQKETALALIEERLAVNPGDVQCLLQQAECLLALGQRAPSLAAADAAAAGAAGIPALDAVGEFLVHADEHRRALEIYDRAVEAAPLDSSIRAKRAAVHRFLGNFDLAASDYDAVLAASPNDAEALQERAELYPQTSERNSVAAMEAALAQAPTGSMNVAILHFGLAKSYEDLGQYALSWRHLSAGNRLERARTPYHAEQDRAVIERIVEGFSSIEEIKADAAGESPIFIVGLPRTGTTLVDRILGSPRCIQRAN